MVRHHGIPSTDNILIELRKKLAATLPPLISLQEAANLAGWNIKTFYNKISERSDSIKGLVLLRRGRGIVFERENFLDWLLKNRISRV